MNNENMNNGSDYDKNETKTQPDAGKKGPAARTRKPVINMRSLKYGSNAFILIAVAVAIAVIVNVLVGMLNIKWDLTKNRIYTIGNITKKVLNGLNKDVTIYGLFDGKEVAGSSEYQPMVEILEQYAKYPHIKIKYVDPDKNPGFIKTIDPQGTKELTSRDFAVVCGKKIKKLGYYDLFDVQFDQQTYQQYTTGTNAEQGFTGAIKYVISGVTPVVYFITGHNELTIDSDYVNLKNYLDMNNYDIKTINLLTVPAIPADAATVIIASPKKDLTIEERDKLRKYLRNGGKAAFLFDSLEDDPQLTQFESILNEFNVALDYDKVKENDESRRSPQNSYDIIPDVQTNSIIDQSFQMVMTTSRSLKILNNKKDYITVTSLVKTSDKAVGEQISKSKGADIQGPMDLAVAAENKGYANPSRILVMGNASFITDLAINKYSSYSQNGFYFFLVSLSWLQNQKDDAVIPPKSFSNEQVNISAGQVSLIFILVTIILPLLILGAGMFVWMRRRHL